MVLRHKAEWYATKKVLKCLEIWRVLKVRGDNELKEDTRKARGVNDCKSCKVRIDSNGTCVGSVWCKIGDDVEIRLFLGCVMDTLKFTAMPFGLTNAPAVFMELIRGVRVTREDDRGVIEGREDVHEVFQQSRSGAKRKLSRCGRNQMGNELILALPEGANDFVVYYDTLSKRFWKHA
ncbi:hypothetical protein Tco_0514672 [Tanacetum coccineum]